MSHKVKKKSGIKNNNYEKKVDIIKFVFTDENWLPYYAVFFIIIG